MPPPAPSPSQSNIPYTSGFDFPFVAVASFEFHPSLSVSEQYTDNYFLTADDHRENFRTTVSPGFSLLINTPRTQGSLSTAFGFTFDSLPNRETFNLYPNLTASVRHLTTPRLTLTLTDSMRSGDDAMLSDLFGIRGAERRKYLTNSLSLAADWQIDIFATQAYYRQSIVLGSTLSGTSQNLDDSTFTHVLGANASMSFLTNNTLRVGYELSLSDSSDGSLSLGSVGHLVYASLSRQINPFVNAGVSTSLSFRPGSGERTGNVSLFTVYALPNSLSVSASLGYTLLSSDTTSDRSTVSTNTSISYPFGQVVVRLGVFQDFRQTFIQGEDFGIVMTRTLTGGASFPITPATSGNVSISYNENDPTGVGNNRQSAKTRSLSGTASMASRLFSAGIRGSYGENQVIGRINDAAQRAGDTLILGAFANIPIFAWLNLNLDYSHLIRDGDPTTTERIIENRGTVSLNASF